MEKPCIQRYLAQLIPSKGLQISKQKLEKLKHTHIHM